MTKILFSCLVTAMLLSTINIEAQCPDELINQNSAINQFSSRFRTGLDSSTGVDLGSTCGLRIQNLDSGEAWARYDLRIPLEENGLNVGDEIDISLDITVESGNAVFNLVQDNQNSVQLSSGSYPTSGTHQDRFTIPAGTTNLNIWVFTNHGQWNNGGSIILSNLNITKANGSSTDTQNPNISNFTATPIDTNSIGLSWNSSDTESGIASQNILYSGNSINLSANAQNTTINGLNSNSTYNFTLNVNDNAGNIAIASTSATTEADDTSNDNDSDPNDDSGSNDTGGDGSGGTLWTQTGSNIFFNGGNIGIGNNEPIYKLDVTGDINAQNLLRVSNSNNESASVHLGWFSNTARIRVAGNGTGAAGGFDIQTTGDRSLMRLLHNGNVGIGTTNPTKTLTIEGADSTESTLLIKNTSYSSTDSEGTASLQFGFANHVGPMVEAVKFSTNITGLNFYGEHGFNVSQLAMTIRPSSAGALIGIGTTSPDSKLTVKGKIHAEEVKVDLSVPGPDYVFKEDYDLNTLEEVQRYIKENGHLPNIPSAKEMEENGVELGILNMKLLEKIEELTLYILEQEGQLNKQDEQLKKMTDLEKRLGIIEKLMLKN